MEDSPEDPRSSRGLLAYSACEIVRGGVMNLPTLVLGSGLFSLATCGYAQGI